MIFGDNIYSKYLDRVIAFDKIGVIKAFDFIESRKSKGYFVGYIKYELKDIFLGKKLQTKEPLLYFEYFAHKTPLKLEPKENTYYPQIKSSINKKTYQNKITQIKSFIAKGDTYQVNFTYPLYISTQASEIEIFKSILENQNTPYKAFIRNEYETIISFSPELFFEIKSKNTHHVITTRPMKGTIKRGKTPQEDFKNKTFLKNDIKNQSENVMIVDLLRNDLSKIALKGSVKTQKLFEINTHPTLHQMTSEICADLPNNINIYKIFEALFPCGSITGAPKIKTMQIIQSLENYQRKVYCGAIGVISAEEICFSVPIRTLYKKNDSKKYTLGVGGGIVWDSHSEDEWNESKLKSLFILPKIDFKLIETMKVQHLKILDFDEHLMRMSKSAKYFGFDFDDSLSTLKPEKNGILRITSDKSGKITKTYLSLNPITSNLITLNPKPIDNHNDFLYHKTSHRPWYKKTMQKINRDLIFDEIFLNQNGEITEGSRSNIIIQIGENLFTPNAKCGLLKGIYRDFLLKKGICREKILTIDDLYQANKIYCTNSVRGMIEVVLKK
ncbi:aminodeoxychorismate synthase component I [Helicobacter sp. 13S00477-4]|uniref:aminodeoxychorismate synthase component I n=1 Tax=Helicobacter sp. 13S00477-4 TaxID=1905759 RepID=UPI000BA53392|nr:aminodeoxychorismate synthase component I [Helicobacter sp. 13S00477-4]PAF52054.1 aminodeoxychorismate synthase, component I [Helicobacter sp. 13S00477-4]